MNFLDTVPAIRRIDTDREDLFAIEIVGHVSAADAENLFGLLEAAYALHSQIDVLVRLTDHEGVDWADIADDTIKQGTVHALAHIGRCAAVGKPNWVADAQSFLPASPSIDLRHFSADDEAAAWLWLGARPIEAATLRSSAVRRRG